jgi:hypothetical protein
MNFLLRLQSLIIGWYITLCYGDVCNNWHELLRFTGITDANRSRESDQLRSIIFNVCLIAWHVFVLLRVCLLPHLISGMRHQLGQFLCNLGNMSSMIMMISSFCCFQSISYRLMVIRVHVAARMNFLQTVKQMTQSSLRMGCAKMSRAIHVATVIAIPYQTIMSEAAVTVFLVINIINSGTLLEVLCWFLWFPLDLVSLITVVPDLFTFPAIWFMTAINYKINFDAFAEQIEVILTRPKSLIRFYMIRRLYHDLMMQAATDNHLLAPIMSTVIQVTTPMVATCMFIGVFGDNIFLRILFPILGATFILFTGFLMFTAADITSKAGQLHQSLASLFARKHRFLSIRDRKHLLLMIEHSSTAESLSMKTSDGSPFTKTRLLLYLIEFVNFFTLLVNLNTSTVFSQ